MAPKNHWITDQDYSELMHFLIEKTKDVDSPMRIKALAREFKEKSMCSQGFYCLVARINFLREKVAEMDGIGTETKVKMIFGLSAPIYQNFFFKLRNNADVKLDENNRIITYKAHDGSLELTGDHSLSAKIREGMKQKIEDSILKTPESTKRSAPEASNPFKKARDSSPDDPARIPESRSREPTNPEIPHLRQPKLGASEAPKSRIRGAPGVPGPSEAPESLQKNPRIQQLRQPRLEASEAPEAPNSRIQGAPEAPGPSEAQPPVPEAPEAQNSRIRGAPGAPEPSEAQPPAPEAPEAPNSRIQGAPEAPEAQNSRIRGAPGAPEPSEAQPPAPEAPEAPEAPNSRIRSAVGSPGPSEAQPPAPEAPEAPEAPNSRIRGAPGAPGPSEAQPPAPEAPESSRPSPEPNDAYTPRIKFLESLQFLVSILGIPSSSKIQKKIKKKLRKSSSDSKISNEKMSMKIAGIVAKLMNLPLQDLSENEESVRFSHFLCYLKAAIMHSKLEGLEKLMMNIERIIEDHDSEKNIPIKQVEIALRKALKKVHIFD